jgi:hypothetical protein
VLLQVLSNYTFIRENFYLIVDQFGNIIGNTTLLEGATLQRSMLDMLIKVYSPTGSVIATFNPPSMNTTNGLGVPAVSFNLPIWHLQCVC